MFADSEDIHVVKPFSLPLRKEEEEEKKKDGRQAQG